MGLEYSMKIVSKRILHRHLAAKTLQILIVRTLNHADHNGISLCYIIEKFLVK